MERHILSKSTYLRGKQCFKSLYLYKNHYDLKDEVSPELQAIFNRGTNIGLLAQKLFPGGKDASPSSPFKYRESVQLTSQLIENGEQIIYEATFQHKQILSAIDILVNDNGKWYAYEVKSSPNISDVYIEDIALQHYVITSAGIELEDISIVHINRGYTLDDKLELDKLFEIKSLKEESLSRMNSIQLKTEELKKVVYEKQIPEVAIGEHCFSPYTCDFKSFCWKDIPEGSVFEISGMSKSKQFELYRQGYTLIKDLPKKLDLTENQVLQVDARKKEELFVDKEKLSGFLNELSHPIYFMDFETFMPVVPIFKGTKPNHQVPFQYSIHLKKAEDSPVEHFEFLAEPGMDPRKDFIRGLLKDLGTSGSILVYHESFEKTILKNLQKDYPEFKKEINLILPRIKDLIIPFKDKFYYHPEMKGLYSIKYVLPALVPDLNYDSLEIQNGHIASSVYEELQTETDLFKISETKENLLKYCELDTLAMVKILEVLQNSIDG